MTGLIQTPAQADNIQLSVAEDKTTGYNRSAFKHWIDADKNGCNTRAEVLIAEAIVKPKIGPKCKLTGGKWFSSYDGKTLTNASLLDVDHLVPLAEAWRSGAWKWTSAQRQAFANDLDNSEALIAVTLTTNRSKGDKDIALWKPSKNLCEYAKNWISIKTKYYLTVDNLEFSYLSKASRDCNFDSVLFDKTSQLNKPDTPIASVEDVQVVAPENTTWAIFYIPEFKTVPGNNSYLTATYESIGGKNAVAGCSFNSKTGPVFTNSQIISISPTNIYCRIYMNSEVKFYTTAILESAPYIRNQSEIVTLTIGSFTLPTPTPSPTPTKQDLIVTPGAFCSPAGAIGTAGSGVTYTCKTSSTDTRNRWRQ